MMAYSTILFLVCSVLLLLSNSTRSTPPACETRYCGSPRVAIEFPFQLAEESVGNKGCGYEGFEVWCKEEKMPLITLPHAGEFVIKNISFEQQFIWINDPEECLAKRLLQNGTISLKDSPFKWDSPFSRIVIFYNCTESSAIDPQLIVPCLSGHDYFVVVMLDGHDEPLKHLRSCNNIGSARIPRSSLELIEDPRRILKELIHSDIVLDWFQPVCYCNANQRCGLISNTNSDVTCYDRGGSSPSTAPRYSTKLIRIAWGISVFLFLGWLLLVLSNGIFGGIRQHRRRMEPNTEQPPVVGVGLDHNNNNAIGSMMMIDIEQCPKIQLSESVQLPKSIDNVCSICLSEYEQKETLRSMPQCKHYFHAHCIDAWLKMNATCPLCRKLPIGSALTRFTTS